MKYAYTSILVFLILCLLSSCKPNASKPNKVKTIKNETIAADTIVPTNRQVSAFLNSSFYNDLSYKDTKIRFYVLDLKEVPLQMVWKNEEGIPYGSIRNFINEENYDKDDQYVSWAMNGGMYQKDLSPQGLYIENGKLLSSVDNRTDGYGNFYLQPNGIFQVFKDRTAKIITTKDYVFDQNMKYATQSGPMLVIDGEINNQLKEGSSNLHFRNAVGILPDGKLIFAIAKYKKINFYDLALFFQKNGCRQALYLDGFVSSLWDPSAYSEDVDKTNGVIMAVFQGRSN